MARNDNSIETIQKTLDLAGQELGILHQISQSISSTLDLDQVLRQIVELVIDVTRGDACLIYLLDDTGDNLVLRAARASRASRQALPRQFAQQFHARAHEGTAIPASTPLSPGGRCGKCRRRLP